MISSFESFAVKPKQGVTEKLKSMSEPVQDCNPLPFMLYPYSIIRVLDSKTFRLHVGGLPGNISEKDLEERFRSFGDVQKVEIIPHPFEGTYLQ